MSDPQQTLTIQQALDLAVQHHRAGHLSQAENIYQQILQNDPNQPVALHLLGVIAHQTGKNDVAFDLITRAIELKSDYAEAHNNLGTVLKELGRPEEAVTSCHNAIRIRPEFAEAHNNLGTALKELGRFSEAVVQCQKAIDLKSDYAEAHNNLGGVLQELDRQEEAVTHHHQAIDIQPDYAMAHSNLGNALKNLGRLEEALVHCRKAIDIKPDYRKAYHNLGEVLRDLGRPVEAIDCFERADIDISRSRLLECVYAGGEKERFYRELEKISLKDQINLRVAAISAFASNQFDCQDPYPFCSNPMEFIYTSNIASITGKESGLLQEIEKQISTFQLGTLQLDESSQDLLPFEGESLPSLFLSDPLLFIEPRGALADLDKIIRDKIATYFSKYQTSDCLFIKKRPQEYTLKGWYILMKKGGHIKPHNHPTGWLSGVLYLLIPERKADEGCIEFGLHGNNFPVLDAGYPKEVYQVQEGDLILFPSSLFHRVIPFQSDSKRLCISFDLSPAEPDPVNL